MNNSTAACAPTDNCSGSGSPAIGEDPSQEKGEDTTTSPSLSDGNNCPPPASIKQAATSGSVGGFGNGYKEETIVIPRSRSDQSFGVVLTENNGLCFVKEVKPGGAAAAAAAVSGAWAGAVQVGDKIMKVNGKSVAKMTLMQIVDLVRQTKEGQSLILLISRSESAGFSGGSRMISRSDVSVTNYSHAVQPPQLGPKAAAAAGTQQGLTKPSLGRTTGGGGAATFFDPGTSRTYRYDGLTPQEIQNEAGRVIAEQRQRSTQYAFAATSLSGVALRGDGGMQHLGGKKGGPKQKSKANITKTKRKKRTYLQSSERKGNSSDSKSRVSARPTESNSTPSLNEIIHPWICEFLNSLGIESCAQLALADHKRLAGKLHTWSDDEDIKFQKTREGWECMITSWMVEITRLRFLRETYGERYNSKKLTIHEEAESEQQPSSKRQRNDYTVPSPSERKNTLGCCPDADLPTIEENFDLEKADPEWMNFFRAYARFKRKGFLGGYSRQNPRDKKMNEWITDQRNMRHRNVMNDTTESVQIYLHKQRKLNALHFVWCPNQQAPPPASEEWESYFLKLKQYLDERGDTSVPITVELGVWAALQRMKYISKTLHPESEEALTKIGFQWEDLQADWHTMFSKLMAYRNKYGDCLVPMPESDPEKEEAEDREYVELILWCHRQRLEYALYTANNETSVTKSVQPQSSLSSKEIALLDGLGFVWNTKIDSQWLMQYRELQAHKKEHGTIENISYHHPLATLVNAHRQTRRERLRKKRISSAKSIEKESLLDEIGVDWELRLEQHSWEERFQWLQEFKDEHGHCLVPQTHPKLGQWIKRNRKTYDLRRNGGDPKTSGYKLTEDQIARLDKIGFVWRVRGKRGLGSQKGRPNIETRVPSSRGGNGGAREETVEEGSESATELEDNEF